MKGSLGLRVKITLPAEVVVVGAGQSLPLAGEIRHRTSPVARAWVDVGTGRQRLTVLPKRIDDTDGVGARHRTRVRGRLVLPRGATPEVPVTLLVELRDGRLLAHGLGILRTARHARRPVAAAWPAEGPRVAVCLATYRPRREWLAEQLDSIRAQSHPNWVCVISDDASGAPYVAQVRDLIDDDQRFVLLENPDNVGVYRNFERALAAAPADAEFLAFSDQDDVWDEDKIATLLERMSDPAVALAFSDMRLIEEDGAALADTFWGHRANKHDDLIAMCTLNTVTGAASLFRADLARRQILPFPPATGAYHDHWTAIVALATGTIAFVDRPLYSYRQHSSAVTGYQPEDVDAWLPSPVRIARALREPDLLTPREQWHLDRVAREDLDRLATFAAVTLARFGHRLTTAQRHWLMLLADADRRVLPTAALALRARRYRGTNRGAEQVLAASAVWQSARRRRQRAAGSTNPASSAEKFRDIRAGG